MRPCPQCANLCDESHKFCPGCGFPIAEVVSQGSQEDPFLNRTLPGGYVILDLVGIGGMGRVYRAEQKALGRTVAVKVIHPHLLGDESAAARFITEARAASRLNHPNSVGVIDFGKTDDGQLYLVMEFLRGRDLSRIDYEEGPLPVKRIINVLKQTLAALAEAHHLGIIHRDLKPENIILEPLRSGGDFVKVVDFGLAKMRQGARENAITTPGIICGTPDYMAPEQGRGAPIDARTDLYAVGVILFQLLTGRLPFEADSPTQVVLMHLSIPPPDPRQIAPERSIPDSLAVIVGRALEKEPDARYASSDDFSAALSEAQADLDMGGRSSSSSLNLTCPACSAPVPRGQKFCGECGVRISVPPSPSRAPTAAALSSPRLAAPGPRLPLSMTGRDEDLAWLSERARGVRSSLVGARIVGEAGVGKTRLLREFVAAARGRGDWVVETGPDPWWADVGYHSLRRTIALLAGVEADGGNERDWNGAGSEARRGLSDIFGRATGTNSLLPEERRYMAAEALRWAIARASARSGRGLVVLVIDDLQRVDGASRNALADALAEPPLVPMLLVASHTPGFEPGWSGQDAARGIGGLPMVVATQLAKGLPVAPAPTSSSEPGLSTQGTVLPLYLDQLVRFTSEGGSNPPHRLADLVSLRFERFGPTTRRVLQALAVLGDEVDTDDVEALVRGDGANSPKNGEKDTTSTQVAKSIDELVAANMIEKTARGLCHTHPLIREIAGSAIPAAVKRDLHAHAAQIADERGLPLEARALHTLYAQDAFEALLLLERVAERALSRADTWGAVRALRRGLDLARRELSRGEIDDPMRAVLIFNRKLGEALAQAGDLTDADGVLREALDLAGPAGQDRARVLRALATVAHGRARKREAMVYLAEALDLAARTGAHDLIASIEDMQRAWVSAS